MRVEVGEEFEVGTWVSDSEAPNELKELEGNEGIESA